ncbi:MAG: HmuY family protein [Bacteroidales bacterium]|nr:HmuY family protein [Bacteroidales bacterium]
MKKNMILTLAATLTVLAFAACQRAENQEQETNEAYIDATSKTTWTYFSLSKGTVVGTGEENDTDNALWAARGDWDLAVCRYNVRTNSGASSSTAAKGGVYVSKESFDSLKKLPKDASFASDEIVTSKGMSGTTSVAQSMATVITFMTNEDGSKVMPPVYLKAPVYVFRTADGAQYYKVEFTQYQDDNKETGHVKFQYARIQ